MSSRKGVSAMLRRMLVFSVVLAAMGLLAEPAMDAAALQALMRSFHAQQAEGGDGAVALGGGQVQISPRPLTDLVHPTSRGFAKRRRNLVKLGQAIGLAPAGEETNAVVIVDCVSYGFLHGGMLLDRKGAMCVNLSGRYNGVVGIEELAGPGGMTPLDDVLLLGPSGKVGVEVTGLRITARELAAELRKLVAK